tara:strand:+ start:510 stop:944 length:435 start_codon:yes stop_codon:yes gene_type:complete
MIKGLRFFGDNNYRNGGLIAAYHNPKSITWRWLVSYQWRFLEVWKMPLKWIMWGRMVHNNGGEASLCLGPVSIRYAWQRSMWRKVKADAKGEVPIPFPADFDTEEGECLACGGSLDTGWECNDCGADHYQGVKLLSDTRNQTQH